MPHDDSPRVLRDRGLQRARLLTHAVTATALAGTGLATAAVVEPPQPAASEAAPVQQPTPAAQSAQSQPMPRRTVYVRAAAPPAVRAPQARPRAAARLAPPPAPPAPVRRSTGTVATSSGS